MPFQSSAFFLWSEKQSLEIDRISYWTWEELALVQVAQHFRTRTLWTDSTLMPQCLWSPLYQALDMTRVPTWLNHSLLPLRTKRSTLRQKAWMAYVPTHHCAFRKEMGLAKRSWPDFFGYATVMESGRHDHPITHLEKQDASQDAWFWMFFGSAPKSHSVRPALGLRLGEESNSFSHLVKWIYIFCLICTYQKPLK